MNETKKNKKTPAEGETGRPRRTGTNPSNRKPYAKGNRGSGEFRIGSRDILATPEILSPFEAAEAPGEPAPRRGKKKNTPASDEVFHDSAPKSSAAANSDDSAASRAPVHNRKGRKKADEAAPAAKSKPRTSAARAPKESPEEKKPVSAAAVNRSRARRGGATIVSAEDSIVVPAATLPAEAPAANRGSARRGNGRGHASSKAETSAHPILPFVSGAKLKVIPLGGLNEVGKNMTVIEYGDDIIIIDCGIGFPDEDEMPGIDLVIPDVTYLEANRDHIRGILITHGHEDHIGAVPYILQKLNIPIYGTRLSLGIIENKLQEHPLPWKADLRCVKAGDTVRLGASFTAEFIHVNHSIADACALAINTPLGMIVHTGDFKLDLTPIDGDMMDLTRFGELGRDGVLLMMCESTNAERPGYTPSETKVGKSLEVIFTMHKDQRIVISTFSSNVHRVQQIINISARHGRKVAVTGRSMINIVSAAVELGYMSVPSGVLIDIADIKRYRPEELTLITTGSQGEPMSALYRMAFGDHSQVSLGMGDLVVLSASAIPGNEKLVGRIINELSKMGVTVINDASVEVHVSGHACQEELKLMQGLLRPQYFMPVHGEYKHMAANRDLAVAMGVPPENVFISDIGKVLEFDVKGARFGGTVPSGVVLIDGLGVGDVGNIVLRDRKHLSQDGLIVVVAVVDAASGLRVAGPDIMSRGFVYVRESEELMEEVRRIAVDAIDISLRRSGRDWYEIKNTVKNDITKFLYARTKRKPMVLPIIMDV